MHTAMYVCIVYSMGGCPAYFPTLVIEVGYDFGLCANVWESAPWYFSLEGNLCPVGNSRGCGNTPVSKLVNAFQFHVCCVYSCGFCMCMCVYNICVRTCMCVHNLYVRVYVTQVPTHMYGVC